jgi:hypothetical protein
VCHTVASLVEADMVVGTESPDGPNLPPPLKEPKEVKASVAFKTSIKAKTTNGATVSCVTNATKNFDDSSSTGPKATGEATSEKEKKVTPWSRFKERHLQKYRDKFPVYSSKLDCEIQHHPQYVERGLQNARCQRGNDS